ncbi:MAG: acyltransferase [Oscillospiraceae bacterium]|nr:acyltransferase [Oscillospiraceae bacterium]
MTEQRKTGRMEELDEFNALACLLVILIHVLSLGVTMLERGAWQLAPVYFLWKLSGFVVPAFLFSGVVKLGRALAEGQVPPYGVYIWRRIRKIYLPYLAASLLYVAVYRVIGVTETLSLRGPALRSAAWPRFVAVLLYRSCHAVLSAAAALEMLPHPRIALRGAAAGDTGFLLHAAV